MKPVSRASLVRTAKVVLALLPLLLLWPALRHAVESRMLLHMLLEWPLLFAAGWAAHGLLARPWMQAKAGGRQSGRSPQQPTRRLERKHADHLRGAEKAFGKLGAPHSGKSAGTHAFTEQDMRHGDALIKALLDSYFKAGPIPSV